MNIGKRHSFQKWKALRILPVSLKKSHFWNIWEERPDGTFHVGASPVKVLFLDLQPQQDRLGFLWITVTPHFELSKFRFLLQGAYLGGQANMGALSNTKRINLNGGDSFFPVSRIHFLVFLCSIFCILFVSQLFLYFIFCILSTYLRFVREQIWGGPQSPQSPSPPWPSCTGWARGAGTLGSPDRYPHFQIEWIFCWIESSQFQSFELNSPYKNYFE